MKIVKELCNSFMDELHKKMEIAKKRKKTVYKLNKIIKTSLDRCRLRKP